MAREYLIDLDKCVSKCKTRDELDRHILWIAEQALNSEQVIVIGTAPADIMLRLGARLMENNQANVIYRGETDQEILIEGEVV
jgi:hypothetical protein